MSAYMLSKPHIDTLVMLALYGPGDVNDRDWYPPYFDGQKPTEANADILGAALVNENLASIHARYPDSKTNPDRMPGPNEQYWRNAYTFPKEGHTAVRPSIIDSFGILTCYEYQSCEHDGWEKSEVFRFCANLRARLVSNLPAVKASNTWSIDTPLRGFSITARR